MKSAEVASLLFQVALRNLWLYKVKTLVIGALLAAGSFLAIVGLSLLSNVEKSMRESIIESVAGHLQIQSMKAKDSLALFGGEFFGRADVGSFADFAPYRDVILKHPNVDAFVPMGLDIAILGRGNEMDDVLDALRAGIATGDKRLVRDRVDAVVFQLGQLSLELAERRKISAGDADAAAQEADVERMLAPGAFDDLLSVPSEREAEPFLQFLETKIAPLSGEKMPIYLGYLGTDMGLYTANFKKYRIVEGEGLPQGERGIMLSQKIRETQLKNLAARLFDKLDKRVNKSGVRIAGDAENERTAADLPRQYSTIVGQLDRARAAALSEKLSVAGFRGEDAPGSGDVAKLGAQLKAFLTVNDENLNERRTWFYANVAPLIRLYQINAGETVTLRSYTRSGYIKSLPMKVHGIFSFEGIEDSDLAGATNIIDLVSFRELYGQMNAASRAELEAMRAQVGVKDVSAETAEDALFGSGSSGSVESSSAATSEVPASPSDVEKGDVLKTLVVKPVLPTSFNPEEVRSGLALNAAIKLKDFSKLEKTREELTLALKSAGLEAKVIDWQTASGLVGQFVNITRGVLIFAIVIIFVVALVIINNSIIVGTFNRIQEIGTMRAIGAQRSFVLNLFLAETGITSLIGAFLGAAGAVVLLVSLSRVGIPATSDIVTFLFSGPRLFPSVRWPVAVGAPVAMAVMATLTSVYAARHAAKVQPVEAMQEKE
ncbi:MAG: FtsX-like permease family protein [Silvanigrellales bacterium]|nr:FtsX-like permease family protein [Silvanigrellales bacterium]